MFSSDGLIPACFRFWNRELLFVTTLVTATLDVPTTALRTADSKRSIWLVVNAAALMIVAVALRVWKLGNIPGINGDEAWAGVQALRWLGGEVVDWRTPNGNPINLFFFLPTAALHAIAPPSFVLLRLTSLASGLLALVTNYFLCRRAFDARTAAVSTVLLALLPIDIAYSRFAWDASQSLLATLLVMYLPIIHCRRHADCPSLPIAGMLALAAAILVHPTNIFAAVLLVAPLLCARRRQILSALKDTSIAASTWKIAGLIVLSATVSYACWYWLARSANRMGDIGEIIGFAQNYLRLFSGTTVFEFICGLNADASPATWPARLEFACDLAFGCVAAVALWGMVRRLQSSPAANDIALVVGWLAMLFGFFVVAGPNAIAPHHERYAICLIAPAALVMSRGLCWWIDDVRSGSRRAAAVLAIAAWLWPASFYFGYFYFVEQTGGRSHPTFRTAAVEPKQQALDFILERDGSASRVCIVCHDWWNYWPLAYLAHGKQNVRVIPWSEWQNSNPRSKVAEGCHTWFVAFAGTSGEQELLQMLDEAGLIVHRETIYDFGGRRLLSVMGATGDSLQNY
jgi:hypothetical protein